MHPPALLVDFDGTTAQENVAEALLSRFCPVDWQALRERFHRGDLSLRAYQEEAFRHIRAGREEMERFVAHTCHLRPGFPALARYCQARDIPLAIVSNGLDFYIHALLRQAGVGGVRVVAVRALFTPDGLRYLYPWAAPHCQEWGNCKCRVLEGYRQAGRAIYYIGDGRSDLCPASRAHRVWARDPLLSLCRERGVPCQEFADFWQVLEALQSGGPSGEGHRMP